MTRWATFDCYGTLVDWTTGIRGEMARVFGKEQADELLRRYHKLEPELEADGSRSYREVLTEAMRRLGAPVGEESGLADSLPTWQPFPEVRPALAESRRRGWRLAILSNCDADQIAASKELLEVPFDETVVAGEIGSYKPAYRHWEEFYSRTNADPSRHVHVGASIVHDLIPAGALGLPTVWINRLDEDLGDAHPSRVLPDLEGLPDALDDLIRNNG
jgi:2-haloacid dehalogenase